jgi:DNA mismatch repair protein MutL
MSDIIKLLPEHVANQIAAGEVIQRPSSVVKELLDNAIDAQSTQLTIHLRDGGKSLIQIVDNGIGMSPMDARMCWERHATSKITKAEDIFQVKTMGFRGEALASIASIAMVELKSKRITDNVGTQIKIEGSKVISQQPVATNNGTTITVKNLFYNIPARRNFLKSDAVELRHIIDEFLRAAIANPEIEMSLYHNENETYKLKAGDREQRILQIFGHQQQKHYLLAKEDTSIVNIYAYVGKPEYVKRTRGEQFIFVNNRFIKDPYLNHAVISCYEHLISKEQFPFYLLMLSVNPLSIDINVHPTKTEIKFEDEKALYQIIKAVVKRALGDVYQTPSFSPSSESDSFIFSSFPKATKAIDDSIISNNSDSRYASFNQNEKPQNNWQELYDVLRRKQETIADVNLASRNELPQNTIKQDDTSRIMMQIQNSIIITQVKSGMMLIDQQSAHERILFERYIQALNNQPIASQQKLFPQTITLNTSDELLLRDILPQVHMLGFEINELGKNTFAINGVPAELENQNVQELIEDLLDNFKKQSSNSDAYNERIAQTLARKASIKPGTRLSQTEMNTLIDQLFACSTPYQSLDGRTCIRTITLEQLFKLIHHHI